MRIACHNTLTFYNVPSQKLRAFSCKKFSEGWISSDQANPITEGELKAEDSPGNFTIEKQANQVIVRVYDRFGTAFAKTFPIPTTGNSSQPGCCTGP